MTRKPFSTCCDFEAMGIACECPLTVEETEYLQSLVDATFNRQVSSAQETKPMPERRGTIIAAVCTAIIFTLGLIALAMLQGCSGGTNTRPPGVSPAERFDIAPNVERFDDGPVRCYIFAHDNVSCVVLPAKGSK